MKPKLNIHLLSTLPRVLRLTHNEVAEASGISIACWYRLVKDPTKITVQQLIGLANGLHVPVSRFFSYENTDVVGMREDYILLSNYQNCYYDSEAVHQRIGKGTTTSWRAAASAVGMHWTNVSSSLLAVSRTPVTRLLELCEAFNFDLFEFLIDPNVNQKKVCRHNSPTKQSAKPTDLRGEILQLRQQVAELSAAVEELTDKYMDLLERHNHLEKTVRGHLG